MQEKDEFSTKRQTQEDNPSLQELVRIDEQRFTKELDDLIEKAEEMRLQRMQQYRTLSFMAMNISILCLTVGVGAFAWFFLMEAKIAIGFGCLLLSMALPVGMHLWANTPLKAYKREHKTKFMPKLAQALNGLEFHPQRGVSEKILEKLAVIPRYDRYEAEDCFMGKYKGTKVILSEARLYAKGDRNPVFDGVFVLLETSAEAIEGHTVITADRKMVESYEKTRWKKLSRVHVSPTNTDWNIFDIFSTKPDSAELFVGDRLLKELAEAAIIFDNAPLTAVLFGKKHVFLMIPCAKDMFEPSDLHVPVATRQHAIKCKKEIEQLLEIIDVFDLYKSIS